MKTSNIFRVSGLIVLSLAVLGHGDRTKDKMYQSVKGTSPCFRRLNATHQVGCSSKRGGSTGAIHYCETQADLDFILKNGTAGPYIPIAPAELLTPANLKKLKHSSKISGLLLYATEDVKDWSHDNQCPNPESSLKGSCGKDNNPVWNPKGTSIMFQDIPFPIFYVENVEDVTYARECFNKHNNHSFGTQRDRSLCSLQMTSFMYATRNTPTCIRRSNLVTNLNPVKFCDPLGDQNVYAPIYPFVQNTSGTLDSKPKYIVVAARLDATSLFEKTGGASSPVTGMVTLLATAKLIKEMVKETPRPDDKNLIFVLFNGESYDYIGSQRLLYDMLKGDFPHVSVPNILPADISAFVELSQITTKSKGSIFAHSLSNQTFYAKLESNKGKVNLQEALGTLPPASLHTFVKNSREFPGLVLSDHEREYKNLFYNAVYDNASNIDYKYLNITEEDGAEMVPEKSIQNFAGNVATMVAKALFEELTGTPYKGEAKPDLQLIDELFHCYLENLHCRVHKAVTKSRSIDAINLPGPFNLYIGVDHVANYLTNIVGLTLAWITGDNVGESDMSCTNEPKNYTYHYYNMSESLVDLNKTRCFGTTVNFTDAVSPAFVIKDYDWSSGQYSSWAESTWGDIKIRLFLKPSAAHENMTIAIGSIVFIISTIFVYFVKSRSEILFSPSLPTLAPTDC